MSEEVKKPQTQHKMIKKSMVVASLFLGLSLFLSDAMAQQHERRKQLTPEQRTEKRLARLKSELTLTDQQSSEVKEILLKHEKENAVKDKQMKGSRKEFNEELDKILTPDQKAKRDKLIADRKEKMKDRKQDRDDKQKK